MTLSERTQSYAILGWLPEHSGRVELQSHRLAGMRHSSLGRLD